MTEAIKALRRDDGWASRPDGGDIARTLTPRPKREPKEDMEKDKNDEPEPEPELVEAELIMEKAYGEPSGWGPEPEMRGGMRPSGMYLPPRDRSQDARRDVMPAAALASSPAPRANEGWDSGEIARRDIASFEAMAAAVRPEIHPEEPYIRARIEARLGELPSLRGRAGVTGLNGLAKQRLEEIIAAACADGRPRIEGLRLLEGLLSRCADMQAPLSWLAKQVDREVSGPEQKPPESRFPAAEAYKGKGSKGLSYDWSSHLKSKE